MEYGGDTMRFIGKGRGIAQGKEDEYNHSSLDICIKISKVKKECFPK